MESMLKELLIVQRESQTLEDGHARGPGATGPTKDHPEGGGHCGRPGMPPCLRTLMKVGLDATHLHRAWPCPAPYPTAWVGKA